MLIILWTIQPERVFKLIYRCGFYRCDFSKTGMKNFAETQYDWLVSQMKKRIGNPPEGVTYPVWAWYRWSITKKRPDLRGIRWYWGQKGDKFYRLEIDIPDSQVLLSNYENWAGVILNNCLLSDTEQEDKELDAIYDSLSPEAKNEFRSKNWERVFDIALFQNEWTTRGDTIQATFWELRRENIRSFTPFITEGKR